MVFASNVFLYVFLPAFLVLYYLTPRTWKSWTLALGSYVFYGWWRPDFCLLMLVSTLTDHLCGRRIHRARGEGRRGKGWLLLSLFVNLGLLAWFKYANFGIEQLNALLVGQGAEPLAWTEVLLPIGISFYTFQTISYTVDVYTGRSEPVKRFGDFLAYVSMFPQLVAGPIVRFHTIADQLRERTHTLDKFHRGVLFFQAGLVKKVLVADLLAPVVARAFGLDAPSMGDAWLGVVCYAFQIYFDFSGYSDMAIGLGLMLGFRLPINFNGPYRASSITDFWRRWHISLSAFLRDYLYIPLGGNKKGGFRTQLNLMLTMLLGGLWHGASWTFVAWGGYQGVLLAFERLLGKKPLHARAPRFIQIGITFVLVLVGWVLFRADDIGQATNYLGSMFVPATFAGGAVLAELGRLQILVLVAAALLVWGRPTSQELIGRRDRLLVFALQPLFLFALLRLHQVDHVPFLYYRF